MSLAGFVKKKKKGKKVKKFNLDGTKKKKKEVRLQHGKTTFFPAPACPTCVVGVCVCALCVCVCVRFVCVCVCALCLCVCVYVCVRVRVCSSWC